LILLSNIIQADKSNSGLIQLALGTLNNMIEYDAYRDQGMLLIIILCFI
jgi:hypothetical protein